MRKVRKKKGEPPAFQMYVGDFTIGTKMMSLAEVGAYTRALMHQWDARSVPGDDMEALARGVLFCDVADAREMWSKIASKFSRKHDGTWRNSRLEKERRKQRAFSKLQSRKGKLGGRPKAGGKAGAKPEVKPGQSRNKALRSSIFGSVRTPPNPRTAGALKLTRSEKKDAKEKLGTFRLSEREKRGPHAGKPIRQLREEGIDLASIYEPKRCWHSPECSDERDCLVLIALELRRQEADLIAAASRKAAS